MVRWIKNNFVFCCALFVALLIYAKVIPIKNYGATNFLFLQEERIVAGKGILVGNPILNQKGTFYSVDVEWSELCTSCEKVSGKVKSKLLLPISLVEQHYPGKFFSLAKDKQSFILEQGALIDADLVHVFSDKEIWFKVKSLKNQQWKNPWLQFRGLLRLQIKRILFAWGDAGGLFLALLTGSREYLNKTASDNFQLTGLSHILALSGLHIGFFYGISYTVAKVIFPHVVRSSFSLIFAFLFVWFAGINPSLLRALLFFVFRFISKKIELSWNFYHIISLSFLTHLVIKPEDCMSASFLFSYASLLGMVSFSSVAKTLFVHIFGFSLGSSLCSSVGAQLATNPISLVLFKSIAPIGIIANFFVSPLITLFLYLGLFSLIICLVIPFLVAPISAMMSSLYFVIEWVVALFAQVPPIIVEG